LHDSGPGTLRTAIEKANLNLFSDDPAVSLGPTDLVNTNPLLGPLANGGSTFTQASLPGSPAINAGSPVTASQSISGEPLGHRVVPPKSVLSRCNPL
jgi:hypothetical protein